MKRTTWGRRDVTRLGAQFVGSLVVGHEATALAAPASFTGVHRSAGAAGERCEAGRALVGTYVGPYLSRVSFPMGVSEPGLSVARGSEV